MRFDDEYKKIMNQKSLSEDFIQNLCSKMTAAAEQSENDDKNNAAKKNQTQTLETRAIEYTEKKKPRKYMYMVASAAALFLICTAVLNLTGKEENPVVPPNAEVTQSSSSSEHIRTEPSVTTTTAPVVSDTPDVANAVIVTKIVEVPQTTLTETTLQTTAAPTEQKTERVDGKFGTADELMEFISSKKAKGSPASDGYKNSGTADLFNDFFTVECSDTSYTYSVKNTDILNRISNPYSYYNETGTVTQVNSSISADELKQFNRIFDMIDREAGHDNYYVYDVYKFSYSIQKTRIGSESGRYNNDITIPESDNYRVEIVLKDYYNKYLENPSRDNVVLSYEIRNDLDYNSDLTSEYQYFINEEKQADAFYSEFTKNFSDCALTIGNVDTEYTGTTIYRPYTTWFRPSSCTDDLYKYHLYAISNSCYLPEKNGTPGNDASVSIYACLFFKPETNPDDINSKLSEMKPLFDKYHVAFITVDILNSDSSFDSYKNGFGYSDVVDSSYRRYCSTYSYEFSSWSQK